MRSVTHRFLCFSIILFFLVLEGAAEQRPATAADPRVGLKPGFQDAGTAIRNMELVRSLPKPDGFFDPKAPAGPPTPPEPPANSQNNQAQTATQPPAQPEGAPPQQQPAGLNFANS